MQFLNKVKFNVSKNELNDELRFAFCNTVCYSIHSLRFLRGMPLGSDGCSTTSPVLPDVTNHLCRIRVDHANVCIHANIILTAFVLKYVIDELQITVSD